MVDVVELLRHWQAGDSVSQMARALGLDRKTGLPQMIGTRSARKVPASRKKACRSRKGSCYYGEPEARTLSPKPWRPRSR